MPSRRLLLISLCIMLMSSLFTSAAAAQEIPASEPLYVSGEDVLRNVAQLHSSTLDAWTDAIGASYALPDESIAVLQQITARPSVTAASENPALRVIHTVQSGDTLVQIGHYYAVDWVHIAEVNSITDAAGLVVGQDLIIPGADPAITLTSSVFTRLEPNTPDVIPPARSNHGRELIVDLSSQMAYAYEDGVLQKSALVSTGLPATPTVQGSFAIHAKTDSQTMSGDDFYLPDVQWVMYFYKGYGFHTAYWHDNFGRTMSHGCVNMTADDAKWFYDFASIGTPVHVQL